MDHRQLNFRKFLFRLGERLSHQDLSGLIFLCKGTKLVRAARMEKVTSATELFQALSERGKLSPDDLSCLAQILTSIGKESLLSDFQAAGYATAVSPQTTDINYMFQECLLKIALDLTSLDVQRMTFVLEPSIGQVSSDKIYSATHLFEVLQQRQSITTTNLRPLYDALLEIGRKDMSFLIQSYMQRANLSSYQSSGNEASNGMPRRSDPFIPYNPPTPSSGYNVRQCSSSSSLASGDTSSDHSVRGPISIEESTETGGSLMVSHTEATFPSGQKQALPFGLDFDVFEGEELNHEVNLLHSLSVKEGELRRKETEIDRLQRELTNHISIREKMVEQRAEDREVYSKSIQDLQAVLAVKNQEVASLMQDLQQYHHQMAALQDSNSVRECDLYAMDRQPHGICIIFNNFEFHHPEGEEKAHPSRGGAQIDQYNLTQTFKYLRYEVIVKENLTAQAMQDALWDVARRDHRHFDSFLCCILTHGETNVVHGADSQEVNLLNFAATMKLCPSLREKPKMFFVQACRGEGEHKGLEVQRDSGGQVPSITATIPQEADFFFGYATPTGNAAYRSKRHGSWYISELCKVFTQHAYTHNLSSMMKKVNNQVSKAYTKEGYKQCPEFVDRLRKEVHFFHFLKGQTWN